MTRRLLNHVFRPLIAGAAQSAKVRESVGAAVAVIHDVADMQPHLSGRVQIVVIAGPRTAHLAGIAFRSKTWARTRVDMGRVNR